MKLFTSVLASFFALLVSFSSFAQDAELITLKFDGVSEKAVSPAEAVREVTAKLTESTARNQVIDLIGEAKYRKNQAMIEKRIISQSSKFIPYSNPGQAIPVQSGFRVSVELKVSPSSLKTIVQSAGLLADSETPGTLVSLVSFTNKTNDLSYKWWTADAVEGKKDLVTLNQIWQQVVTKELEKKKFKVSKIQKQFGDEREVISTAQAQMVLRGEARIRNHEDGSGTLSLKVGVYQASDSRLFADVTRTTKIPRLTEAAIKISATQMFTDASKELTQAVFEAWQAGIVGSSIVQISAMGSLTPKQLENFKAELGRNLRDLKNLRERKFSSGNVVLEADFKGTLASLSDRLRQTQLPGFQTEVGSTSLNQIELKVKARR